MKYFRFIILFLCFVGLSLTGCKKATVLESDTMELNIPMIGATDTIMLHSDVNDFRIEECPDWVLSEVIDSTLIIFVRRNDTGMVRTGEILIMNGDLELGISVTQFDRATYLDLPDGNDVVIPKEGETVKLRVDSDGDVVVDSFSGIETSYDKGILTISAPPNDQETINGVITLTAGDLTRDIRVTLEGSLCLTCNGTGKILCEYCHGDGIIIDIPENGYQGYARGCEACGGSGVSGFGQLIFGQGYEICHVCHGKGL